MSIDLLAFPGHKGLLGPLGTGGLYIRPGLEQIIATTREASDAVAERIVTLAEAADGRAAVVADWVISACIRHRIARLQKNFGTSKWRRYCLVSARPRLRRATNSSPAW